MGKATVDTIQNPWVALIAGFLVALGGQQFAPGTTWGQLLAPDQLIPMLALIGGLLLTLNARRPGEPPETRVEKAIRDLKRNAVADNERRERARRPPPGVLGVLLALTLVALTACGSTGAGLPPHDRARVTLQASAATYEALMIEAGRLSATCLYGTLPDCPRVLPADKLETVSQAGERVHDTLELARVALESWLVTSAPADEALWGERWRAYRDLLDQLLVTAASFGVHASAVGP